MLPIILIALFALIIAAKFCPDAPLSRIILKVFGMRHVLRRKRPPLSQVIPYTIATIVLALVVVVAPELTVIAAGLDVQLLVDLILALSVAMAQVGIRRIRTLVQKAVRAVTVPLRAKGRHNRMRRTHRSPADGDDSEPAAGLAFA